MGIDMKKIRNGLYLMAAILALCFPMQAAATGQDSVSLIQEEDRVAIVLEMGNAQQEKISGVAISLQVNEESREKVKAEFDFNGELAGASKDFFYDETTGILDIYAASDRSVFNGDILNLGYVRIALKDSGQTLPVEISYLDASFQTVNEVYGEKKPMVGNIPEPVNMQVGQGTGTSGNPGGGNGNGNAGQGGTSGGNNESSGSEGGSGSNNMDQGLHDENTQLVNDPASAQKITTSVIGGKETHTELVDMSQGVAASTGGKVRLGGSGKRKNQSDNKVSVVSPENGPASILITKGEEDPSGRAEEEAAGEGPAELEKDNSGESISGEEEGFVGEEILLDQENGGAKSNSSEKGNHVLTWLGLAIVLAGGLGFGTFVLVKTKASSFNKKSSRKKPADGERKKPARGKKSK